jgi:DNA invertase Pin-like site-specific DNA recombinase
MAKALAACRRHRATLIVAELDRLARSVAFVSRLMESGAEFLPVEQRSANRLVIHILASVAENEARAASARTKAALAARQARGLPLGNPVFGKSIVGTAESIAQAREALMAKTLRRAEDYGSNPPMSAVAGSPRLRRVEPAPSAGMSEKRRGSGFPHGF